MSPALIKSLSAVVIALLGLAGTVGVPGVDGLDLGSVGEKISLVLAALSAGGLFVRQHWIIGEKASTQPVEHFAVATDAENVVRGEFK
jgi:hypothetical protein